MDIRHMVRNILLRNGKIKQILLNLFIHKEEKTYQQILRGSKVSERRKTVRKIQQKMLPKFGRAACCNGNHLCQSPWRSEV